MEGLPNQQYNNPMVYPPDFQQNSYDTMGADQAPRPMDSLQFNDFASQSGDIGSTLPAYPYNPEPIKSMDATLGERPQNPQPTDPRVNFTEKKVADIPIDDINAWLANSGNRETVKETLDMEKEHKTLELKDKQLKYEMRKKILETIESLRQRET